MLELKTTYKGYEIKCKDWNDRIEFVVSQNGETIIAYTSLDACEKYIDSKVKEKFKRVAVIYRQGWRNEAEFVKGEATSIIDKTNAWVISTNGKREKKEFEDIFLDNESNLDILKNIAEKKKEKAKIQKDIDNLLKQLQGLSHDDMKMNGGK